MEQTASQTSTIDLVSFILGGGLFAAPLCTDMEIVRPESISPIPGSPKRLLGCMKLRDKIVHVYDARICLGMPEKPVEKQTRVIVMRLDGRLVGCLVDSVTSVIKLRAEDIRPMSPELAAGSDVARGLWSPRENGPITVIIDPSALINTPQAT